MNQYILERDDWEALSRAFHVVKDLRGNYVYLQDRFPEEYQCPHHPEYCCIIFPKENLHISSKRWVI